MNIRSFIKLTCFCEPGWAAESWSFFIFLKAPDLDPCIIIQPIGQITYPVLDIRIVVIVGYVSCVQFG